MRNISATEKNITIAQKNLKITQETSAINLQTSQDTLKTSVQTQLTERFTKAIEQLGNEGSLAIRLGGIYALERIAKDSDRDHWPIMEVLTAYIRERSPWLRPLSQPSEEPRRPPADIQAILNALTRRTRTYRNGEDQVLDLIGTDLRGANLIETHFEAAKLRGTHLEGAFLRKAHLKEAFLYDAHLERAKLIEADLTDAKLSGANLTNADLSRADLRGALLRRAKVMDISFPDAIGLTKAQIESAITDETTQLPEYLDAPAQAGPKNKSDMDTK